MSNKYLMIENPGVCPVECFTLMGVSTSRDSGNEEIIGEFGTGSKQAVCLLLREFNVAPTIFCDLLCMEYSTIPIAIDDGISIPKSVKQVVCKFSGKDKYGKQVNRSENLGFVVEMGAKDWNDSSMALREYIANAIDRSVKEGKPEELVITAVEDNQVRAKKGCTRVFIPMEMTSLFKFISTLPARFLHFEKKSKEIGVIEKRGREFDKNIRGPVFYKMGVRVTEDFNKKGLFDYNWGSDFKIGENRVAYSGDIKRLALNSILRDTTKINPVMDMLLRDENFWEQDLNSYDYSFSSCNDSIKKEWVRVFNEKTGERGVLATDSDEINVILKDKGYLPIKLNSSWKQILTWLGVKTVNEVLNEEEREGITYYPPGTKVEWAFNLVWGSLIGLGRIKPDAIKPDLRVFSKVVKSGLTITHGFRKGNIVAINADYIGWEDIYLIEIMWEEVVHFVSGCPDFNRGFQNYLFKTLAAYAMRDMLKG